MSRSPGGLGSWLQTKGPLLPCCVPTYFLHPGAISSHPPSQAPALSAPHRPPPQGFQDPRPEFRSIFAQTKQEDGFNTSPCCRRVLWCRALPKQVDTYGLPIQVPSQHRLGHAERMSQVIRGSLQISSPPDLTLMKSPHLKPGEVPRQQDWPSLDQACPPVAQGGCEVWG